MRTIYFKNSGILRLFSFFGIKAYSQDDPSAFMQRLFNSLKEKSLYIFLNNYISSAQNDLLVQATVNVEGVTRDLLDKASLSSNYSFEEMAPSTFFADLIKQTEALHIDLKNCRYADCTYQIVKSPRMLCTSLRGTIVFRSGEKYYQWELAEAVTIRNRWKLITPGKISELTEETFLTSPPENVSAFPTIKVKVTRVALTTPPMPDNSPLQSKHKNK